MTTPEHTGNAAMETDDLALDGLKDALRTIDARLERQNALQRMQWRQGRLDRAQSNLRTMKLMEVVRIGGGIALMYFALPAWTTLWPHPLPVACGLLLHLYAILLCIGAGRTLWRIGGIDFAAPVLDIQQKLARLRAGYLRDSFWLGNAWWVLWLPVLVVIAARQSPEWLPASMWDAPQLARFLLLNVGVGVVGMAVAAAGMAMWRRRRPESLRRFEDRASPGIAKARAMLAELEAYDRD